MKLELLKDRLIVQTASGLKRSFAFPAAGLSLKGKYIPARTQAGEVKKLKNGGFKVCYQDKGIRFEVTIEPSSFDWFYKTVVLKTDRKLPTPDFVTVDEQQQNAPGLRRCGYMITGGMKVSANSDEEGSGSTPGCGYPLIGGGIFTGLEHPAAFSEVISADGKQVSWRLRHHPVWHNGEIRSIRAVTGISDNPRGLFMDYLAGIRLPKLNNFLVSFCSFWSDPYVGNYEYKVDSGNYLSLVRAFSRLGLRPDIYTLDAGWQNRKSFYDAKPDFGGNAALQKIASEFRACGADLSLWVSHNGPMGMDWDFLASKGIASGSGQGSAYPGDHFGVLLDSKLEKALTKRFCELCAPPYDTVHFKIDWDNDCASAPEFRKEYPTQDHVREASISMMFRVAAAMRKVKPDVMIRNGWWPSPWWLSCASHVFLTDSGDSEYSSFPSLSQRDAASTHRDAMYYASLRRDQAAFPLDAFDNHEFPHALRNPFVENPETWGNICIWEFMRGASYIPMTLQPESMEKWQVEILRDVLAFVRGNAERILTGQSYMLGGCPSHGEIYGFCHPDRKGRILLALRNPSPVPQEYSMPDLARYWIQVYPCCRNLNAGGKIWFAPHEVKIFEGLSKPGKLPAEVCQLIPRGSGRYQVVLPASCHPSVAEVYQLPKLEQLSLIRHPEEGNSRIIEFGIRTPYKMHNFMLSIRISRRSCRKVKSLHLTCSRYPGMCRTACWSIALREIPWNFPGYGENKNTDLQMNPDARYFAAEIPQGGECFFNLILTGKAINFEDVELFVSGYESPALNPESAPFRPSVKLAVPPPHPEGFPLVLKLENTDGKSRTTV